MILPIDKILCPTDFSEPSRRGLKAGNELAVHFSAELIIVHVISILQIAPFAGSGADLLPRLLKDAEFSAKENIEKAVDELVSEGVNFSTLVYQASPAETIVRVAQEQAVDLIVIATHGQSGWKKFISGSVTERVVRMADRPVMTIHGPEDLREPIET